MMPLEKGKLVGKIVPQIYSRMDDLSLLQVVPLNRSTNKLKFRFEENQLIESFPFFQLSQVSNYIIKKHMKKNFSNSVSKQHYRAR